MRREGSVAFPVLNLGRIQLPNNPNFRDLHENGIPLQRSLHRNNEHPGALLVDNVPRLLPSEKRRRWLFRNRALRNINLRSAKLDPRNRAPTTNDPPKHVKLQSREQELPLLFVPNQDNQLLLFFQVQSFNGVLFLRAATI